ncbi:MAG: hypothetical protein M5U13_15805 [Thermoanaerobaculia bacterium]|nr:hypothetical protein [Thermoanaerobaculia bacterium]
MAARLPEEGESLPGEKGTFGVCSAGIEGNGVEKLEIARATGPSEIVAPTEHLATGGRDQQGELGMEDARLLVNGRDQVVPVQEAGWWLAPQQVGPLGAIHEDHDAPRSSETRAPQEAAFEVVGVETEGREERQIETRPGQKRRVVEVLHVSPG